ncbi:hypothetical protein Tco_1341473, partial [Tanacetum coccineum]
MTLPPRDQRQQYLRYEGLQYTDTDIVDFEMSWGFIVSVRRHLSWREFILALKLHTAEEMQTDGFGLYWAESARQIPDNELIACSIAGRSQSPEKVTVTDLFYLREMDVGSVNVPYLLARYLRLFASGRKQGAMIFGGQFLPVIDMTELARLQICIYIDDTWDWVAPGLEKHPDAMASAPEAAEDAPIADEDAPAASREILDSMAYNFSQFSTWTVVGLSQMMSRAGVMYTSYADFQIPYERRTRCRTDGASTSIAQQDEQQPDP